MVRIKKIWKLILFSIITLGIYSFFWLFKTKESFKKSEVESKIHSEFLYLYSIIWVVAISSYCAVFFYHPIENLSFNLLGLCSVIVSWGFLILISFEYRKIINSKLRYGGSTTRLSSFFTFVFNIFYLQYEMNRITENKENELRRGPIVFSLIIFGGILPLVLELILIQIFTDFSIF